MAKINNREDALLQAYLGRYKTAQGSTVTGGQQSTQKAQKQGSAILNATDKTLPSLGNPYESTLKNIVSGAATENSLNLDFLNRQVKLAKAQYDAAQDYAKQMEKAQSYAAKAAAKAAKRRTGKGNTAGQNTSTDLSDAAANALNGLNSSGTNTNSAKPSSNNTTSRQNKPSAQEQYLADKASGKRKAVTGNSYAERSGAAQPAQSRAVTKGGKVIGSSYAAAGSAPSASERTAAKDKRNDYKSQQEDIAAALKKLQTDADYRAELAAPGRKLTSAEVAAVSQYEKGTKNTGFSGLKRVFDLAKNSDNLSKDEYAKKSAELNAELNQNSALRSKAQGNGAGQSAQAFTAGLYDSVPFLSKASDAMASAANATGLGPELPMLTKTLEDTKTYDPVAATLGTMAGKAMQYKLFNTLAAGTKYGKAAQAAGGKIGAAAQKIPGLGALVGDGFGDAAGRVLADTGADLVLDTLPSLASDVSEGKSAGEVAGNAAKNIVGNVAMNALPEIGGAVFNKIKGAAGDAAQDAAQEAAQAAKAASGAEVPKESPYYDDWLRTQGALRQEQTLADLSGEAADMQIAANRLDALNAQNEALLRQNDIWQAEQNKRMARQQALDEIQARYEDAVNRLPTLDNLTDTSGWQTQQGDYYDGGVPYLTKDNTMSDTAKGAAQSLPLNGSESVPEHAVGAASTQYDRREVLNQDYANQRRFNSDLEPDEVAALGADQNTHTLYTRKESADTARLNYDTYLQQGDGSISEANKAVLQDLRGKTNWNADDIALAKHAAEQQRNYLYTLEKGSDEYNLEFARYKQLDSETSRGLSGAARTLYEGREAKPNGYTGIQKFEQYTQVLTDDFAKTREGKGLQQVADVVYNGEINDFLTQLEKENRLDEAMLEAEKQIRNAAKAKNVKISDDAVKSAAASLVAGGNAEDMFNALARTKLGIGDISQDDYDFVRGVFERVADMPDSKARRDLEMSAYSRLAQYMPAKSFGDKVNNIRYLCMLGNTRTHGRNILGNILMNTVVRTKDNVAGVMQLALPQEQRTKAIGTMLTADGRKMADLARDYADNKMYSVLYDNGKYNVQTGLEGARRIYKDGTIGNALESLARVNSNALEKEDAYFLKSEFGNSMASFLKARGYDSSVFTATDDASKQVLLQAAAQALNDAKVATFHEDNFLSTALSNLSKDMRYNGGAKGKLFYAIEEGILPFKKTPLNIAKNAIDYAGGSYLKAGAKALGRESATEVIDELAKGVTGSAIMGIGYILARNGFLTGGTTGDDRADAYRDMNGEQEYAVKIPGKGTYTLDWASPAAVPLLVGAEIAQDNSELTPGVLLDKFRHLSQPVLETTMLQGLNDTLDNISYADSDEKLFALLAGGAGDFARQFVPTVLGQAARTVDPVRRSSYGGGQSNTERDNGYALRSTMNKIPGLSRQNEPYIDQWGREQASLDGTDDSAGGMFLRGAYNMLSPGYIRQENITPVDEYLQQLYTQTGDSGVLPEKARNYVAVDGNPKYYLTPEEKTQYAKTRGQISYDAVDSLRQNSMFLRLPEDQQNEIVQDVYTVARTAAAADTLGDGVSGTNSKAYKAYEQGGIPMLENYLLADSAIKDAGATKQADVAKELLNSGLDSEGIYNSYILKYPKDQKAPAVYSQYGADGARNWLRYQAAADIDGNGRISQDEARAVLDAMNLTDEQRAYYYLLTNSGWSAKNNPYGGA